MNMAGWFSQPRKMMEWPSEKQLELDNLMEACEENFGAATLEFTFELLSDRETTKLLPGKLHWQQSVQAADMDKADDDQKSEPYEKILDSDEELEDSAGHSQRTSTLTGLQAEEDSTQLLPERAEQARSSACTCCRIQDVQQKSDELGRIREKIQMRKLSKKERKRLRRTFWPELQEEREKSQFLQKQLRDAKRSYLEECVRWKCEVEKLHQQAETAQQQLECEVRQNEFLQASLEELKQSLQGSSELQSASELQAGEVQSSCEN